MRAKKVNEKDDKVAKLLPGIFAHIDLLNEIRDYQRWLDLEKEENKKEILSLIGQCENRLKFADQVIKDIRLLQTQIEIERMQKKSIWKRIFYGPFTKV